MKNIAPQIFIFMSVMSVILYIFAAFMYNDGYEEGAKAGFYCTFNGISTTLDKEGDFMSALHMIDSCLVEYKPIKFLGDVKTYNLIEDQ